MGALLAAGFLAIVLAIRFLVLPSWKGGEASLPTNYPIGD